MMTQQLGFSILTAPLAAIDRRSLSQAWYSALHPTDGRSAARPMLPRSVVPLPTAAHVRAQPAAHAASWRGARERPGVVKRRSEPAPIAISDRRNPRSLLAQRIARALVAQAKCFRRSGMTLRTPRGRVHVTLQSSDRRTRVIAVCSPALRDAVKRALDEARYALAMRGIAVQTQTRGTHP